MRVAKTVALTKGELERPLILACKYIVLLQLFAERHDIITQSCFYIETTEICTHKYYTHEKVYRREESREKSTHAKVACLELDRFDKRISLQIISLYNPKFGLNASTCMWFRISPTNVLFCLSFVRE